MSIWACNEKHRLVRTVSPRKPEKSIISQVPQDNILLQMDNPENQQGLYEPPQHGGNVTLPVNPVLGGGNGNLLQNQYRVHPACNTRSLERCTVHVTVGAYTSTKCHYNSFGSCY